MALLKLLGTDFAVLLDFSVGVFIVYVSGRIFMHEVILFQYFIGGFLGLAPDFDVIYMYARYGKFVDGHHQYLAHRPLIGIGFAALIGWLLGGPFWALVASCCLLWHYIHDTEGFSGSGIAWFWPFSKRYYSPFRIVNPEDSLSGQNRDKHNDWLDTTFLFPSHQAIIEIAISSIFLGIVGGAVLTWWIGILLFVLIWLSAVCVWSMRFKNRERRHV